MDEDMDATTILLEIRNEQVQTRRDLDTIKRKLGLLGQRGELERMLEAEREEKARCNRRGAEVFDRVITKRQTDDDS